MKILHLCLSAFYIDNYSYQENELAKYHVKMGHDVTVIASLFTFGKNGEGTLLPAPSEYDDANGIHVIRLAYKKPLKVYRILRSYVGLAEALERELPDIIFSHNVSYSDTTVVAKYLRQHPNVRLFADNHADFINSAKKWFSRKILHPIIWRHYAKVLEPFLTRCYGVTPMRCRFLKEMYKIKPELIHFLPMGVDDEAIPIGRNEIRNQIRNELRITENDIVIVTGGKIDKLKNTHVLIDALSRINNPKLHLIICGILTPEMKYLEECMSANPNIHYLGWCKAEQVMNCMVASDMACYPGTHSTLWEQTVGLGLPVVFKHWPEMEHVNVNNNCIFVKGEDAEEIAAAIKTLLSNYNLYSERAKEASKHFLYSRISKKAIEL